MSSYAPPDSWWDEDALPPWMHDALTDAQRRMSSLSKWTYCMRLLCVSPTVQHVALVLATYMDVTTLKAWPSVGTLSHNTGRKKVTVREAIRVLERSGWLDVERHRNARGDERTANTYYGTFPPNVEVVRATGNGKVVELWNA